MSRSLLLGSLFLLPFFQPAAVGVTPCPNVLPHEPIVVYEVAGFGLAGQFDLELLVYGDGSARLSSTVAGGDGKAQNGFVGQDGATALLAQLTQAQAFFLCDQDLAVSDVPLQTLTVLRPKTDGRGHTFSWWIAEDGIVPVQQTLDAFIASTFPNF